MQIPAMVKAQEAVWFYHEHIVLHEASPEDLDHLPSTPESLALGYEQCFSEADEIFTAATR
jgi:hypothetical protein